MIAIEEGQKKKLKTATKGAAEKPKEKKRTLRHKKRQKVERELEHVKKKGSKGRGD